MKYEWIIDHTKATKNEVDHCIRWLKSAKMIATEKATRGFIIKVSNYNGYQRLDNYKSDNKSDTNGEVKAKQKRNKSDTINKNGKNDKNNNTSTNQKKKIYFDFEKEIWENITEKDKDGWKEAYPACNIDMEIIQMKQWLLSNPDKKKILYRRFITNWLSRSQDKGGTKYKKENYRPPCEE